MFGEGDLTVEYGPDGKCSGVKAGEHIARTKLVLGDPSYFGGKTKKVGQAVRAIALLDALPAGLDGGGESGQVIFPGGQVGRTNDLYLFYIGASHKVAPEGKFLAFLSTTVELPVLPADLQLLKAPLKIFYDAYDLEAPAADGVADQVFISESYDPTSHFETAISDVMAIWKRITGKDLVLTDGPPQ